MLLNGTEQVSCTAPTHLHKPNGKAAGSCRLGIPPLLLGVDKATEQGRSLAVCMHAHLRDLRPLSVREACTHVLLKVQACLCFWDIPKHLSLEELTAHFCRCTEAVSMRSNVSSILVRSRCSLCLSQVMKLHSKVASMT